MVNLVRPGLTVSPTLTACALGTPVNPKTVKTLASQCLQDERRAQAFDISAPHSEGYVEAAIALLQAVYAEAADRFQPSFSSERLVTMLWQVWIPLSLQLVAHRQRISRPLVQGILGSQGTGKTTLAAALTLILSKLGYRTVSISLDDLYKTYRDRCRLREADPRLIRRGPPGTHDVDLGLQTLQQLVNFQAGDTVEIPRFDKSAWQGEGDRCAPDMITTAVDFVLFEGWFVGVRPVDLSLFSTAPPPIVTDADRQFARDMNVQLQDYLPLWQQLDRLLVFDLVDHRYSKVWRKQAEHQMIATGKPGMTDADIDDFVEYFWRALHPELFMKPLIACPDLVDLVIEIQADHSPGAIYRPAAV